MYHIVQRNDSHSIYYRATFKESKLVPRKRVFFNLKMIFLTVPCFHLCPTSIKSCFCYVFPFPIFISVLQWHLQDHCQPIVSIIPWSYSSPPKVVVLAVVSVSGIWINVHLWILQQNPETHHQLLCWKMIAWFPIPSSGLWNYTQVNSWTQQYHRLDAPDRVEEAQRTIYFTVRVESLHPPFPRSWVLTNVSANLTYTATICPVKFPVPKRVCVEYDSAVAWLADPWSSKSDSEMLFEEIAVCSTVPGGKINANSASKFASPLTIPGTPPKSKVTLVTKTLSNVEKAPESVMKA